MGGESDCSRSGNRFRGREEKEDETRDGSESQSVGELPVHFPSFRVKEMPRENQNN